ncbi:CD1845 family protein [Caproiciproducens sp. CPB-2]|uniref:CD1845 family protein n=1 Tax=Caproiciproducens sp. CPB-2 TaxID=3030017 RepID=UPI003FA43E4A
MTFLEIVSGIGALIGVIMLFTVGKFDGSVILALSFLISPLGIPAIAEWLIDRLNGLNYSLRDFITG